jgi:2,4-dienoyl-CoA reductase-like NADH-dependent reductase (Old Yellow Enzyme family)
MTALFTPMAIGGVEIRNRIVMPSMTTRLADADGYVTPATIAYFRARAQGGVGLITVEMASPERVGRHRARELGIYDDRFVPRLQQLVAALQASGAKASIQLGHAGGHTRADICGETPIAPSAVPHFVYERIGATITPLAMTHERIEQTTKAFVAAAQRAHAAGFDCVELHAAHGYLLSQFLCPAENTRTDEYGGTLENRARISLDILRRIKATLPRFAVIFRVSVEDFFPGGIRLEEGVQVAKWAAAAGADAIHVTAGHYRSLPTAHRMIPPMTYPDGEFLGYAHAVKREVGVPVIAVGRLGDPALALAAVDSGKADFVALGRPLLADPDWVNKVRTDIPVRRCLACNTCVDGMRAGDSIACLVNPSTGREGEFIAATGGPRGERICVIGAGPAGLSYASIVARDNRVTVIEREQQPGGAFRYAGKAPLFQEVDAHTPTLYAYIDALVRACAHAGVDILYGLDARRHPEMLRGYDRIIIATGATYRWGGGAIVRRLLEGGWGKAWPMRKLFAAARVRNWLYFRARVATGTDYRALVHTGQKFTILGDAARAGKGRDAIESAFRAAYFGS